MLVLAKGGIANLVKNEGIDEL